MVRAAIHEATALRRRSYVPDADRTPDRDDAADWLEEHLVDGDWDWQETSISEISEATGYSRQHIATTLEHYFEPVDGDGRRIQLGELAMAAVDREASGEDFESGFRQGFEAGVRFVVENQELIAGIDEA